MRSLVVFSLCLLMVTPSALAAEQSASSGSGWKDAVVTPVFNWFNVKGDKGRFRQDSRVKDGFSAGVEEVSATTADEKVSLDAYAISETDYGHTLKVKLSDSENLEIKGKYFRQYYDGSGEPWDPAPYLLPAEHADWEDEDLYADRLRESVDYRREIDDVSSIGFGYDLWGRFGRERLLRGERSTAAGQLTRRSIPARSYLEGLSHTFYGEYRRTLNKKYNFKLRPSFEIYNDQQDIQFYRYATGALSEARTFLDSPKFIDFNTAATLDTFVNDDTYFFTGYLFNYLKNESVRSEVRPFGPSLTQTFRDPNVDNERISNTGNLGTIQLNFLGIKDLRFHVSTRAEAANTNSRGFGMAGSSPTHRESRSDIGEYWLSESLGLNFKGFTNTNIDVMVDLDQRHFDHDEYWDGGSSESVSDFGAASRFYSYNADIFYNDLKNTWRISRRFNSHLKVSSTYRLKYQNRDYDTNVDTVPIFYPGVIGDIVREVHEAGGGLDIWWLESWSSSIKYQHIGDTIHTEVGGDDVQNLIKHRVTATLVGQPVQRVTLFGSASYESNELDTPTDPVSASTWYANTDPYDFHGDYLIYNINAVWQANDKTKIHGRYQQTNSFGSFQSVQENVLYELRTGMTQKLWESASLKGEFFYFDFNDKNDVVPGFDNYDGYGFVCSFQKKF